MEKQNSSQAIVIADTFNRHFASVSTHPAFLTVVNSKLIDYSIKWLNGSGIDEIIIMCPTMSSAIKDHIRIQNYPNVNVIPAEDCRSFGDVMRTLDRCAIIRNNFILLTIDTIGNVNLLPFIDKFKTLQHIDSNASMLVLLNTVGKNRRDANKVMVAYNENKRLLVYRNKLGSSSEVDLPMESLLDHSRVIVRRDIISPNLAVCSMAVPALFTEYFDVQTYDEFVKCLLLNEELASNTVYCDFVHYVTRVRNWPAYQQVSKDIMGRWTYPQVPDVLNGYQFRTNNVYVKEDTKLSNDCRIENNSVIGSNTFIAEKAVVKNSVIGNGCYIDANTIIDHSFVFDGVKFGIDCNFECSAAGENSSIGSNSKLYDGQLIHYENSILTGTEVRRKEKRNSFSSDDSGPSSLKTYDELVQIDAITNSDSGSTSSSSTAPQLDDATSFSMELSESLLRGTMDNISCENLILEINSSRHAYNMSVSEVNYHLMEAILTLSPLGNQSVLQGVLYRLKHFKKLIENYIKNEDGMRDCLLAVENVATTEENVKKAISKILMQLYDENVLTEDAIMQWYEERIRGEATMMQAVSPFIRWLEEASEESE